MKTYTIRARVAYNNGTTIKIFTIPVNTEGEVAAVRFALQQVVPQDMLEEILVTEQVELGGVIFDPLEIETFRLLWDTKNHVQAIKHVRLIFKTGLKESKDFLIELFGPMH